MARSLLAFLIAAAIVVPAVAREGEEVATARLTRATGAISVDGSLDDPGWNGATRFETWYETNPGDNVEPKVRQVGTVTYDDHFLYVGIDMWDSSPSQIRAVYGDHDNISGNVDDFAGVLLDTRNDGKTGYEFFVTASNVQYDAVTDDTAGNEDSAPDFFWDSAVKRNDHGWSVEIRIPFSSLRYKGANPAAWGLALYRNLPRERRYQIFSVKLPRGGNCFVCRWAKVSGLEGLPAGGHVVAAPYVTARQVSEAENGLGTPLVRGKLDTDAGADVKWTPNADTAVDATLNPDFSQVESDVAAISTNQRFALFFPEKRPFFLEGTELFNTPIQAVYTRTITAPRWGLRSTGKYGNDAYTVLVADDRGGGSVILPSALGSDFAAQDFSSYAAIGRLRHDVGGNAFVSFLATTRESSDGHNRVLGPDFQWKSEHHTITGQLLLSDSSTPNRPDLAGEWNGQKLRSHAGHLWYSFQNKNNDLYTEYKDFGDEFRADNGFVPQVGYRSNYAEAGHTFFPEKKFFSRVRLFTMGQYDSMQDGSLLYRLASAGIGADGKYRSFARIRFAVDKVRSGDDVFTRHQLYYNLQFGLSRILSFLTVSGWAGQDVDFANNRLARGADVATTATLRTNDHLQIGLTSDLRWLTEDLPAARGRLFTSQVERIRAMYTFNSRTFVRAIVQNQRTSRNRDLYSFDVSSRRGSLATQLLVAYKINWQTLVYLGAGDLREVSEGDLRPSNRQVFMKVSYAFQR